MNSPNTSSDQRRGRHVSAKAMLIAATIVLALLLAAYAWGRLEANSRHKQQTSALQARLDESQRALSQASNRNHLLRARTQLYRAAADLDQRNFGNANDRLRAASTALGEVTAGPGQPAGDIAKLRSAIGATDVNVAINLEAQRERILGFARQLDALSGETN